MTAFKSDSAAYADYYVLPASFGQERLWFLAQLEPGSDIAYHMYAAVGLSGRLDRIALQRALDHVLAEQEALRTGLAFIDGELRQVVLPSATLAIPVLPGRHLAGVERDEEVRRLAAREATRPFALDEPPLMRLVLLEIADDEHVLVLVLHHLVADGWSVDILLRELASAYAAAAAGALGPPHERPVQYADYAVWQRDRMTEEFVAAELAHWRARLHDVPALELPTDRPRPAVRTASGAVARRPVPDDVLAGARAMGRDHDATLFMVLLAAFEVVLSRYSGQSRFAIGSPVANRTTDEVEGLIGLFANTLVLPADVADDPTFTELLGRVRAVCLDAYDHQELPFERLVQELRPVRDLSRTPLFQAMFVLQNVADATTLAGLVMSPPLEVDARTAKFDVSLSALLRPDQLDLALEFSTDLFDTGTGELMLDSVLAALATAVRDPGRRISGLTLATPDLVPEPTGGPDVVVAECVDDLVADAGRPNSVAVSDDRTALTYADLWERVGGLAARLAARGAGPDRPVAVYLPRGVDVVAALLAVWRTGAAYVPVDPAYPDERIAAMLDDAAVHAVVSTRALATPDRLRGRAAILVDEVDDPSGGPVARRSPGQAAYVIYTSGSTGRPKGVQVSHRNLATHLVAMRDTVGFSASDTLVAVTSVSFDIAGLELFLPLVCGGRVVVATADEAADGERLAALLRATGATIMQATPATWRLLLAAGWQAPSGFRALCGGEALDAELAARLLGIGVELWNVYGPTEATVWASAGRVNDPDRVRLGDALPGARRYLLDGALRPVPVGAVGELFLGGACVADGYRAAPGLTAERFLPDPFAVTGARMYRTGDLCRYTSDGGLQFLGRADDQLKVRGFRVEPVEIEAVLARDDDVAQVAVTAHRMDADDVRLVAHVQPRPHARPAGDLVSGLRTRAARQLPPYAVPAMFNLVDAMPLTPAGKLDRRALRDIEVHLTAPDGGDERPASETERTIGDIFAETLGLPAVGLFVSFFELGGHSLLAAKLVTRIRDELGVVVPVRALFEEPTVAGLAAAVEAARLTPTTGGHDTAMRSLVDQISDDQVDALLRSVFGDP